MKKLFLIILLIPLLQYSQNNNKVEYKLESGLFELVDSYLSFEIPINCIELSGENLPPNKQEGLIFTLKCYDDVLVCVEIPGPFSSLKISSSKSINETNKEIAKQIQDEEFLKKFKEDWEQSGEIKYHITFMDINGLPSYKVEPLNKIIDPHTFYFIFQKERTLLISVLGDEEIFDKTINSIDIEARMTEQMKENLYNSFLEKTTKESIEIRDSIQKERDKEAAQVKKTIKGFYKSGAIKIEGFINDLDEADGLWNIYNKNGEKFCIINFDRGCVSTIDTYSSDGFRMSNDLFLGGLSESFYNKACLSSLDNGIRWCYFKGPEAIDCQLLNEKLNNQDKKILNTILKYVKNINDKISVFNENGKADKKGKIKRNSYNQFVFIPN